MSERSDAKMGRGIGRLGRDWDDLDDHDATEEELKLAGFYVGGGLYGIDIMRIKEVLQARPYPIRPVPHAPAMIEGVIELRGVVIPVVDLRKRFGVNPDDTLAQVNKLIIVSVRGRIVGLKVDKVLGELRVPVNAIRPAPSMLSGAGLGEGGAPDAFFSGVCKVDENVVFVVNLEGMLGGRSS